MITCFSPIHLATLFLGVRGQAAYLVGYIGLSAMTHAWIVTPCDFSFLILALVGYQPYLPATGSASGLACSCDSHFKCASISGGILRCRSHQAPALHFFSCRLQLSGTPLCVIRAHHASPAVSFHLLSGQARSRKDLRLNHARTGKVRSSAFSLYRRGRGSHDDKITSYEGATYRH